mmetsp:Transcript_78334/g.155678  ORF Transcript_78334/g.155678 Transcript_78334/m.155678 type:complete len:737 (-) Transcript_78334:352-2562(-)
MGRRFLLVGLMVVVDSGTTLQVILGTLLAAIFLLLQVQTAPYRSVTDNYLASASSFSLLALFLTCIVFKYADLTDLDDIQVRLSEEQRKTYNVQTAAFVLILLASLFGTLLVSVIIFAQHFRAESRRRRREARAARARRLRYLKGHEEVPAPQLTAIGEQEWASSRGITPWHLFLSHNWAEGQSDMRVIKTRLLEMIPDLRIFLDVDNLGSGTLNSAHIDISATVLCFCTPRFFTSGPCAQELVRAVVQGKALFSLLEPVGAVGGLHEAQCRQVFADNPRWPTEVKPRVGKLEDALGRWRHEWRRPELTMPTAQQLEEALFATPPLIWSRLSDFQDVTLRLIAERVLHTCACAAQRRPPPAALRPPELQTTYMQGEIADQVRRHPIALAPLRHGRRFHLYCSPACAHAADVAEELHALLPSLQWTANVSELPLCEQLLVHLTTVTWACAEASAFAREVEEAMRLGVRLVLAHEVPGARVGDSEARKACQFGDLFEWTPPRLLPPTCQPGVYGAIAMNLAGDEWRQAGLIRVAQQVALGGGEREQWKMQFAEHPEPPPQPPPGTLWQQRVRGVRIGLLAASHLAHPKGTRRRSLRPGSSETHSKAARTSDPHGAPPMAGQPLPVKDASQLEGAGHALRVPNARVADSSIGAAAFQRERDENVYMAAIKLQRVIRGRRERRQHFLMRHQTQRAELLATSQRASLVERPGRLVSERCTIKELPAPALLPAPASLLVQQV